MLSIPDHRLRAQLIRNLWKKAQEGQRIPPFVGTPTGYLQSLILGKLLAERTGLVEEENVATTGVFAEAMLHWQDLACPTFHVTRDAVETFLLTDVGSLTMGDLMLPYPAFLVRLPEDNPLVFLDEDRNPRVVHEVWARVTNLPRIPMTDVPRVLRPIAQAMQDGTTLEHIQALEEGFEYAPHLMIHAEGDEANGLFRTFPLDRPSRPLSEWLDPDQNSWGMTPDWKNQKSRYTISLVCRVLANLCLWLDASDQSTGQKHWHRPGPRRTPRGNPPAETFVVGRGIRVPRPLKEVAKAMGLAERDEDTRRTWTLLDQRLVRGHWKKQAFGPGYSQHRRIGIAPYWRGEGDQIVSSEYVVGKS